MVISTKELLNFTVDYYKDEDQWLTSSKSIKNVTTCELRDIVTVKHMSSCYKCHVMSITFDNYAVLIGFKSRTTMETWVTKLNYIKGNAFIRTHMHAHICTNIYTQHTNMHIHRHACMHT